jgi:hypothetical protein
MKVDWKSLYESVEKAEKSEGALEIKTDPEDKGSSLLDDAELAYYKTRLKVFELLDRRRQKYKTFYQVIYKQKYGKGKKVPNDMYQSTVPSIFLQYTFHIFSWAQARYNLSYRELCIFLYLYPVGVFDRHEFSLMVETFGGIKKTSRTRLFRQFKREGRIVLWKKKSKNGPAYDLYELSGQAKDMCSKVHRMFLNQNRIPETHRNPLMKEDYFSRVFKEFNSKVEEKQKSQAWINQTRDSR